MKTQRQGGRYIHHDNGQGPQGRDSSPLRYQKGQAEQDRRLDFSIDLDGARVWCF